MMRTSRPWLSYLLIGTLALSAVCADAAVDPVAKCRSAKLKAASKQIVAAMTCLVKAKATATPLAPACLTRAADKADAAYGKAGTACPGDGAALLAAVDDCVATLSFDVPGDGKCPSVSAKAAGKGAGAQVKCRAIDSKKPGSFAACDAQEDASTAKTLANAGTCGQAAPATIASHIDRCEQMLHEVVVPPPTTTTTSSTSTSFSTTTTTSSISTTTAGGVLCGGGFLCNPQVTCGPGEGCSPDASRACVCGPAPSCGSSSYPTCGGACPDGLTCAPQFQNSMIFNLRLCACVPPDLPCAGCGFGACPPGSACVISSNLAGCTTACGAP
jgi:hypothetical protein